jgi:hypothetical protein
MSYDQSLDFIRSIGQRAKKLFRDTLIDVTDLTAVEKQTILIQKTRYIQI